MVEKSTGRQCYNSRPHPLCLRRQRNGGKGGAFERGSREMRFLLNMNVPRQLGRRLTFG